MIAIPKRGSGGIRSISLVDVFCKIANNCALKAVYSKIDERCGNLQWGVGRRFATEIIYHTTRFISELDPSRDRVFTDKRNAFNEADRGRMFEKVLDAKMLSILPLLRQIYSEKSSSWIYDATTNDLREIVISTGVRQGDPLGPALYALSDWHFYD